MCIGEGKKLQHTCTSTRIQLLVTRAEFNESGVRLKDSRSPYCVIVNVYRPWETPIACPSCRSLFDEQCKLPDVSFTDVFAYHTV